MSQVEYVLLNNGDFQNAQEVHELLAEVLEFPTYYGYNLDALNDCLGDVCSPLRIEMACDSEPTEWFVRICRVVDGAARENANITPVLSGDLLRERVKGEPEE